MAHRSAGNVKDSPAIVFLAINRSIVSSRISKYWLRVKFFPEVKACPRTPVQSLTFCGCCWFLTLPFSLSLSPLSLPPFLCVSLPLSRSHPLCYPVSIPPFLLPSPSLIPSPFFAQSLSQSFRKTSLIDWHAAVIHYLGSPMWAGCVFYIMDSRYVQRTNSRELNPVISDAIQLQPFCQPIYPRIVIARSTTIRWNENNEMEHPPAGNVKN